MLTHHDPLALHVYTDFGRFYSIDDQNYPGVGTILTATDTLKQQEFWEQWRSIPENSAKSEAAKERGKLFHKAVEDHLQGIEPALTSILPYWQSVQTVLPRIEPLLIESAVWHPVGCYAGTVDMVCAFNGQLCVLDWKTATRPKKPEYLDRYPLQLTAYCACINRMYGTRIKTGVIVVALPNREAQVFQFALTDYWKPWLSRLVGYWEQQSTPLAKQVLGMIYAEYPTF